MLPVTALLTHLRIHAPDLARRLDGIVGLERAGGRVRIRIPSGGWCARELEARTGPLASEVRRVFGAQFGVELVPTAPDPERLPFPVLASKHWNHVVFLAWTAGCTAALAVPKPRYLETWLVHGGPPDPENDPEAAIYRFEAPLEAALPQLLDRLAELARRKRSYAQIVAPFPGDHVADRLEGLLYRIRDWGTPRTPAPVLQRYTGRIHYTDPDRPPLGIRLVRQLPPDATLFSTGSPEKATGTPGRMSRRLPSLRG